jgi:Zinc knuckle/Retrotransposon gag protein
MANPFITSVLTQDIPCWSTASTIDARAWFRRVDQLKLSLNANNKDSMRFVAIKMNDNKSINFATRLIRDAESTEDWNWTQFQQDFIAEFDTANDEWQVEAALMSMFRKREQSLAEYARSFDLEAARCDSISDDRQCRIFIGTLDPPALKSAALMTFNNAKLAGVKLSVKKLASMLSTLPDAKRSSSQLDSGKFSSDIDDLDGEQRSLVQSKEGFDGSVSHSNSGSDRSSDSRSNSSRPRPVQCYRCNRMGHFARDCQQDITGSARYGEPDRIIPSIIKS